MLAEGVKYVRRASPLRVSPTPDIRRAVRGADIAAHRRDAAKGADAAD